MAQWRALLADLRKPGDSVVVDVHVGRVSHVLNQCGRSVSQYIRTQKIKGGARLVRLAKPKHTPVSNRTMAQWRALLADLRKPGDSVVVDVRATRVSQVLNQCGRSVSQYIRVQKIKDGVRLVRLAQPKNFLRQLAELLVGESLILPARAESTLATIATRVRRAHPERRYRTHRDRRAGTFSVVREA